MEYEHALAGPQKKILRPGEQLSINAVVSRRWVMMGAHRIGEKA